MSNHGFYEYAIMFKFQDKDGEEDQLEINCKKNSLVTQLSDFNFVINGKDFTAIEVLTITGPETENILNAHVQLLNTPM